MFVPDFTLPIQPFHVDWKGVRGPDHVNYKLVKVKMDIFYPIESLSQAKLDIFYPVSDFVHIKQHYFLTF